MLVQLGSAVAEARPRKGRRWGGRPPYNGPGPDVARSSSDVQPAPENRSLRRNASMVDTTNPPGELVDTIRDYFRGDRSRMTMMAARKFRVPEQVVVEALVGHWPIVRLRDGVFRELMDELPSLGTMRVFVRSRAAVI